MRNSETTFKSTAGINQSVASSLRIALDAILKQSNLVRSPCKSVLTAKHKRWLTACFFSVLDSKYGSSSTFSESIFSTFSEASEKPEELMAHEDAGGIGC